MRRILFTMLAAGVIAAAVPTLAFARHHHSTHHRHHSHARVRHERFGSTSTTPGTTTSPSAGTVASFTNGLLTIKLTDGTLVSGMVTADTEIECQASAPAQMQSDEHGGGDGTSGSGDNGDGSGDQGDDQGDGQQCTTSALAMNAVVQEAELSISSAGAVWSKVELG
ncbi:MAG TPA: hypothetical protein VG294_06825 [Solirubrobacteraceae bacterium]|jgi:hypothetical protein|nr:hypothetical protein [Solirubrobacteraceae bacterium]